MSEVSDTNAFVAALLRDLAEVQTSKQSKWGYQRAAAAIVDLEEPLGTLRLADGSLRKIPQVGPSSTRVILEVLDTGGSPTVEQAVAASPRGDAVRKSRALRAHFFSRARVRTILNDRALKGIAPRQYRGDLQMHSTYSDGVEPLETLIEGCLARGYAYCAITDHSYGLPIAKGLSMADVARQHEEIDALNRRYKGRFRMLKGIEANIQADGALDLQPDELTGFELVLAAPHSALRVATDQTARLIGAIRVPGVNILAHPRGRKLGARSGLSADWGLVFRAAAAADVAIEIDGDPSRQDVDFKLAADALAAGCVFALDSDAHATRELPYADTALAHARLAGIPASKVINTWPVERLLEWAAKARAR